MSVGGITHRRAGAKVGAAFPLPCINDSSLIQPWDEFDGGRFGFSPLFGSGATVPELCAFGKVKVALLQARSSLCRCSLYPLYMKTEFWAGDGLGTQPVVCVL